MLSALRRLRPAATGVLALALLAGAATAAGAATTESAEVWRPEGRLRFLDRSLRPGVRVEVKGNLRSDGDLQAEEVELVDDVDNDAEFEGPIEAVDTEHETFVLFGRVFRSRAKTEYVREGGGAAGFGDLVPGLRVKVEGEADRDGRFKAGEVSIRADQRPRARLALQGNVESVVESDRGVAELRVSGIVVVLAEATELVGANGRERPVFLGRVGVVDEDDVLFTRPNRIGSRVTYAGEVRLRGESLDNFDVDPDTDDDESTAGVAGTLAFAADLGPVFGYATLVGEQEYILSSADPFADGDSQLRVGEAYLQVGLTRWLGVALGRQAFNEEREWYYNTRNLDAVRLLVDLYPLRLEASISRDLFDNSRNVRDQDLTNVMVLARYELRREIDLEGWFVDRHDRSGLGDSPRYLGLRLLGNPLRWLEFWVDAARNGGTVCERVRLDDAGRPFDSGRPCSHTEGQGQFVTRDVRAAAFDVGATFRPRTRWDPTFSVGWAQAGGEDDGVRELSVEQAAMTTAATFRQTGLHRNRWKWNGVVSFRTFGEVLEPGLANLRVLTGAVGLRPLRRFSLDLVYHDYRQDVASRAFHDLEIDDTPDGSSTDLGDEWDLVVGYEPSRAYELRLTSGLFRPGPALGADAGRAFAARFQAKFRF